MSYNDGSLLRDLSLDAYDLVSNLSYNSPFFANKDISRISNPKTKNQWFDNKFALYVSLFFVKLNFITFKIKIFKTQKCSLKNK